MESNFKAVCVNAAVEALLFLNETAWLNVHSIENLPRNICCSEVRNVFVKDNSSCVLPWLGNEERYSRLLIFL